MDSRAPSLQPQPGFSRNERSVAASPPLQAWRRFREMLPSSYATVSALGIVAPAWSRSGRIRSSQFPGKLAGPQVVRAARRDGYRCRTMPARVTTAAMGTGAKSDGENRPLNGAFFNAFWKFLRPHTIRGTVLGSCAVTLRALLEHNAAGGALDWPGLLPRAALGVLALLAGNGFIVGINQIYDVDMDRVNKPFLPIAAGELTPPLAWALCVALAVVGAAITATTFGPLITGLYCFGLFLGTIYSVPPLRLKRFPLPAFLIIATVRGVLLNFGVYYSTRAALRVPFVWSPCVLFITCFVTVFATAIAITKDLPDVQGDVQFGVETFATRLGVKAIAWIGASLLLANYAAAAALGLLMPTAFNLPVMLGGHAIVAVALSFQVAALHRAGYGRDAVLDFYRAIWSCFYIEYAMLPFM